MICTFTLIKRSEYFLHWPGTSTRPFFNSHSAILGLNDYIFDDMSVERVRYLPLFSGEGGENSTSNPSRSPSISDTKLTSIGVLLELTGGDEMQLDTDVSRKFAEHKSSAHVRCFVSNEGPSATLTNRTASIGPIRADNTLHWVSKARLSKICHSVWMNTNYKPPPLCGSLWFGAPTRKPCLQKIQ